MRRNGRASRDYLIGSVRLNFDLLINHAFSFKERVNTVNMNLSVLIKVLYDFNS